MDKLAKPQRRTMIGCVFVVLAVIATMFIYVYPLQAYYQQKDVENKEKSRLELLQEANAKMREERKDLSSDEEIEKIAREQYRLVKPGEEAYIVSGQETTTTTTP